MDARITRVVAEFEESMGDDSVTISHHDETPHHQATFAKDTNCFIATFNELDNPFLACSKEQFTLDTKDLMTEDAIQSILYAEELGVSRVCCRQDYK